MSSEDNVIKTTDSTELMYMGKDDETSEELPTSDWSSLIIEIKEENKKKALYAAGLYEPGSREICTKYIPMSASSIIRHPYYNYPAVLNPGIKEALFEQEEKVVYPSDGQELYLAVCKEFNQCPVRSFYNELLGKSINLSYYCINPYGVKAMAMALQHNRNVTVIDLTDNFLNDDACYHLSEMLVVNSVIKELNLSGCRIGPSGAKRLFANLPTNRSLQCLNLSRNELGDEGVKYIAESIIDGLEVPQLYLNYNNLTGDSANCLTESLEFNNKITHLDLSWNKLSILPHGTFHLLYQLSESEYLEELNLAWNSLSGARIGAAIKNVMTAPKLKKLNLSSNRLSNEAITNIAEGLVKAESLVTLDLSNNPMSIKDAQKIVLKIKSSIVSIQNLLMENVFVDNKFLRHLQQIKNLKTDFVVAYGDVLDSRKPTESDMREILLNRAEYLAKKPKKRPVDFALVAMQLLKDNNITMTAKDFANAIGLSGAPLDEDLVDEMVNVFAGPKTAKSKTIDIRLLVDFIKRKWPERKLPPTPPPEIEAQPEIKLPAKKGNRKTKK
ncbi:unnamed protein product [Parnassius apollo]|uniref:(apollo) hypothetical protein n=1 Tax=Parnassius apollo TaxID=110799 RepID=A0A8S3Y4K7_PARAO|nr:unnamed protein product [Parnassius apollo]